MTKKPVVIPANYAFTDDVKHYQETLKRIQGELISVKRTTVIEQLVYSTNPNYLFTKLFQNKALLELGPYACMVLVHICCNLKHNEFSAQLSHHDFDMGKRTFYAALLELILANVIRKIPGKKELYWINALMVGNGDLRDAEISPPG